MLIYNNYFENKQNFLSSRGLLGCDTTPRHKPEDRDLNLPCRGNLKCRKIPFSVCAIC
jgi:hypothetical protein